MTQRRSDRACRTRTGCPSCEQRHAVEIPAVVASIAPMQVLHQMRIAHRGCCYLVVAMVLMNSLAWIPIKMLEVVIMSASGWPLMSPLKLGWCGLGIIP
jgi:hypothetical protein